MPNSAGKTVDLLHEPKKAQGSWTFAQGLVHHIAFAVPGEKEQTVAAPWWAGRANLRLFGEMFSFIALASLWSLLAGYGGLASVGQQAYVGFGGYALFGLAMFFGVPPLLAIMLAGILGALIAAPIAPLLFRLQGAYFAIGIWVLAEVFRLSFAQWGALGGGSGISLPAGLVTGIAASRDLRETRGG